MIPPLGLPKKDLTVTFKAAQPPCLWKLVNKCYLTLSSVPLDNPTGLGQESPVISQDMQQLCSVIDAAIQFSYIPFKRYKMQQIPGRSQREKDI